MDGIRTKQPNKLVVAAMGDLHVRETPKDPYRQIFSQVSERADILLLCGDLTNLGLPAEAAILASDLAACRIPVLGVFGNHDHHSGHTQEITKILTDAKMIFLDHESYELNGVGFAGVKGFGGGFDNHMLGPFGEDATKHFVTEAVNQALRLENAIKALNVPRIVVAMHYSPIKATVVGEPEEIFPFLGCSRFEETLNRFDNVAAIFHGHSHRGQYQGQTQRGIPVFNCAHAIMMQRDPAHPYSLFEINLENKNQA